MAIIPILPADERAGFTAGRRQRMGRIKENARLLYEKRRQGVSLVVAMCAAALILGLALSVIRSAALLLDRAGRRVERERCCQLAQSFAGVLEKRLQEEDDFCAFVNDALESGETVRCRAEGEESEITVTVHPSAWEEDVPEEGAFPYEESLGEVARIREENRFLRCSFTLEVAAALERESFACKDVYCRWDTLEPRFFREDGEAIYWDGVDWYADPTLMEPVVPPEDGLTITYRCDPDDILETTILRRGREGGGP